jgi:prevent-host-death family protein
MEKITATDAKNHFGILIDKTRNGPVLIEKQGRPSAVLLSPEDFAHFEKIEDLYWSLKAELAEKDGYLTADESAAFLKDLGT